MRPSPREWERHLLPRPHEIDIGQWVDCRPADVSVRVPEGAGELEEQAAAELRQLFIDRGGAEPHGSGFEILLGTVDADGILDGYPTNVGRLLDRPNREQAYIIAPQGRSRLLLSALDGRGIYYAARTLHQLLEITMSPERVALPLATVCDWPDITERGLWNFPDEAEWIPWMASLKLNYGKMAQTHLAAVERDQPNSASIDADLMREAARQGFNYTPYILHLNFLHDLGLFRAYPELAGKGDGALCGRYFAHKQGNQHRVPCASQPGLVDIIAAWMASIAGQGAPEISCWLSERPGQCECLACTATSQFVLEARAFTAAWRRVQSQYPKLKIRLFLSTTTVERDHQVIAEAPPEVLIERACATELERVLHHPRDLMANPLLDQYAAEGRWIASYDVPIGAYGAVDTPEFKVPERSAHRIKDYALQLIRRNYSGAYGMLAWATLAREINGFNIEALAEWSWNGNGRNELEFATAWATRHGFAAPETVGRWAALMGPIEFDVYDSGFPMCYSWGRAIEMVAERRRPALGEGMFRYYADEAAFEAKKSVCAEALALLTASDCADLISETRVVATYIDLAHAIYGVAEKLATADLNTLAAQSELVELVKTLSKAGTGNAEAIADWRHGLGPEPWHHRVHDAIAATETTVAEIGRIARERYLF